MASDIVEDEHNPLRPKGKIAVLCATPQCGIELYVDPLDDRLTKEGFLCSFCSGEERLACHEKADEHGTVGRSILKPCEPCPTCGSTVDYYDLATERVVTRKYAA